MAPNYYTVNILAKLFFRGGRLKEIRIRTQARKFLYLWITKTFGKFTYSQVQQYHIKKIKAKFFKSWKNTWWENCGEMKMMIRAEYFNRYGLCLFSIYDLNIFRQT